MKTLQISGRCLSAPPPSDWRDHLADMLGAKPRRIGTWAELCLYGALRCMDDAGEQSLPQDALLVLASRNGTYAATDIVLGQMRCDLPMPLAFLQTQPSQALALLAARLDWQGQASYYAGVQQHALLQLVAAQVGSAGLLLGWVDEMEGGSTNWLRLHPVQPDERICTAATRGEIFSPSASHLLIEGSNVQVCHKD